ncbi:uncharacterized protein DUF3806 [Humibacillus xanthopallidus]|uniref:Uncharacterized protein DUF3806 n=1 Tax=Humibacillus xanthopallidus TaxID=412689 RepID=A0A543PX94_9MICO|nr:DUF3806 domain-containing protein [Humibacillus xanthopallidus]TQN48707.1 uncharacterized protein DUF3806 [Humibacillus xanthopallidus]
MGLFSRKDKDAAAVDVAPDPAEDDDLVTDLPDRPVARSLDDAERARIAAALEAASAEGVDVDDLESIGSHYDEAFHRASEDPGAVSPDAVVEAYAIAIGEHLARHSAREWAVVTDVFGTDLGLVAARADTVIVPHNLVGARWMRRETGWIPGVVSHLVRIRPRPS